MNLIELKIAKEVASNKHRRITGFNFRTGSETKEMQEWISIERKIDKEMEKIVLEKFSSSK